MAYKRYKAAWLNKYPAIEDLRIKAQKRIPNVAWQYLETGTGQELCLRRNQAKLNQYTLTPQFCKGPLHPETKVHLFGSNYDFPFGIAPIGLSGLIWPRSECFLAETAQRNNIPYTLSTVATETPEMVADYISSPNAWFQLYPPKLEKDKKDILRRVWNAGFRTLLVTADVPTPSRRERAIRAGFSRSPSITPSFVWQGVKRPQWSIATLKNGLPKLKTIAPYASGADGESVANYLKENMRGSLTWEYCKILREEWKGNLVLKGIMDKQDAIKAASLGFDGILVSNHGGRQFDGAPAAIEVLADIRKVVPSDVKILFDSGVRSGLDVLKAISLGADFVLLGRAFMYGLAGLGVFGGDHVIEILRQDLLNNMTQLGIESLNALKLID